MIVVNLFGTPGAGKSTGAAYIFSRLKMLGINAELVTEFVKDKVYEESKEVFNNQAYIFGKQYFRISRVEGKVDVVITDSPVLLSVFYNKSEVLGEEFSKLVNKVFHSYDSMNYLLLRNKLYNHSGRFQTEEESDALVGPMIELLKNNNVKYKSCYGDLPGYDSIVEDIMNRMMRSNNASD